jgi:hypothetical protein
MTWKTKIQQANNKDIIDNIAKLLQQHSENNIITAEQLKKIQDLANNADKLKNVLRFL